MTNERAEHRPLNWSGNERRISPEFGRRAADDPDLHMRYLLGESEIAKQLTRSIGGLRSAADLLEKLGRPIGAKALRDVAEDAFEVLKKVTVTP